MPTGTFRRRPRLGERVRLEHATVGAARRGRRTTADDVGGGTRSMGSGRDPASGEEGGLHDRIQPLTVADHQTRLRGHGIGRERSTGTYTPTLAAFRVARARAPAGGGLKPLVQPRSSGLADGTLTGADFIVTSAVATISPASNRTASHVRDQRRLLLLPQRRRAARSAERFSETRLVSWQVIGTAKTTSSGLAGGLAGWLGVGRGTTAPFASLSGYCYAAAHRFEMVRH